MTPRISYAAGGSCCAIALITRDEPSEVPASIYVRMVGFVMLDWPQSAEVGRLPFVGYKLMCVCPIDGGLCGPTIAQRFSSTPVGDQPRDSSQLTRHRARYPSGSSQ